ncbi:MAG: DUF1269 domain-containing protein [Gammaproteobacteria bacterium]
MRRLYFLLPDVETAAKVVDDLLLVRIEERHIHLVAKEGIPLGVLPEASLLQKSDFVPAVERGVALGGAAGLLSGLVAVAFPPAGVVLGGGALLASALVGAGLGVWMSGMIGVSVPNSRLKQFEEAVQDGQLLMLVDIPKQRVDEVENLVRKHFPKVEIEGTEPTIPAFP